MSAVEIIVPRCCEVIVQGTDECAVFDHVATWVREHYADIDLTDLRRSVKWEPDPTATVPGDARAVYAMTLLVHHRRHAPPRLGRAVTL